MGDVFLDTLESMKVMQIAMKAAGKGRAFDAKKVAGDFLNLQENFTACTIDNESVVVFLAGYCSYKIGHSSPCERCIALLSSEQTLTIALETGATKELDLSYINVLTRGRLQVPSKAVYAVAETAVKLAKCLTTTYHTQFLQTTHHQQLLHTLTVEYASALPETAPLRCGPCTDCGESLFQYLEGAALRMTNIMLNNFSKLTNNATKKPPPNKEDRQVTKYKE